MASQLELARFAQQVPDVMEELALPHTSDPTNNMVLLPYDPSKYPGQDPLVNRVEGDPLHTPDGDETAEIAQAGYGNLRNEIEDREGTKEIVEELVDHVSSGGNVAVVTPHAEMTDIAVGLLTVRDLMTRHGYEPPQVAIIISKMLSRIAYELEVKYQGETHLVQVDAVFTLQKLCNDIYETWPRTESAKPIVDKLNQEIVSEQNAEVIKTIKKQLRLGGVLLGVAATGTTRIRQTDNGDAKLADINDKTAELLIPENTLILPMVLKLGAKVPYAAFISKCINARTAEEVRLVMQDVEKAHNDLMRDPRHQ